ncbi:hypothetical protein LZ554_004351 [Drepanopeziza brunnea f. sp. 'monogermtubi']|nr:hypothetical protein LZ554_004351 [Drepanopeziza brunnea f. sp. 'monogermtubi']
MNWIRQTIKSSILQEAILAANEKNNTSIQFIVEKLRAIYKPTDSSFKLSLSKEYNKSLQIARQKSVSPAIWIKDHRRIHKMAKMHDIYEVQGTLATKAFLSAVGEKWSPTWASLEHAKVVKDEELGFLPEKSLDEYFASSPPSETKQLEVHKKGIEITTRAPSNRTPLSRAPTTTKATSVPVLNPSHTIRPPSSARSFATAPTALTIVDSSSPRITRLSPPERGYKSLGSRRSERTSQGRDGGRYKSTRSPQRPKRKEKISAAVIDPDLITKLSELSLDENHQSAIDQDLITKLNKLSLNGLYTMTDNKHQLSDSTLLDNCGATHLVNDKNLLVPRSIRRSRPTDFIKAKTSSLPVIGRSTRVFKGALNGPNRPGTKDLTLKNVAIVKGFNINIISKALLSKAAPSYKTSRQRSSRSTDLQCQKGEAQRNN